LFLSILRGETDMGKPLGDDMRRRLLAYDQGQGTLEELASRFLVPDPGFAAGMVSEAGRP
jgi:hypothetical protein